MAKGTETAHIPYRNSKLTQCLKPALHREGVAVLVVTVNPSEAHHMESTHTLNFASQVMASVVDETEAAAPPQPASGPVQKPKGLMYLGNR